MFNRTQLASYCAQYAFNLDVSNETVWVDGIRFESFERASEVIQAASASLPTWLAAPDVVEAEEVEELLPEIRLATFDLQPLVAELPTDAFAYVSVTEADNAADVTLITPHRRIVVPLEGVSATVQAALISGNCEVAFRNKALIISYVL
jgi:hypothetical protein